MAQVSVMIVLLTGIHLHLSRLFFGIDLTLDRLVTTTFDSAFATVFMFATAAIFMACDEVAPRNRVERFLFWFTLAYMAVSVPVHVRAWFVPDNPETLRLFPVWYSALFLCFTSLMLIGWWNRPAKPVAQTTRRR